MAEVVVTQTDNGKSLELSLSDIVVVRLSENPTTGYRWFLEPNEGVTLEASEYALASSSAVGGGGERTFKLRPTRAGNVAATLKHWREWEGETSVTEKFQLNLQVH